MSNSIDAPPSVSFVFLNTVFLVIDPLKQKLINLFLDKWYIHSIIPHFGSQSIVLYKVFPNSALAQKEQSSLSF